MGSHDRLNNEKSFFVLNGKTHSLSSVPGDTSLNTYIREYARLMGTKFMCREGGCGACVVTLQFTHPATSEEKTVSVNSCMFPVHACHGLKVTTVEGIGSKQKGYHEVQTRLANFYGTQCGYCTPGWVMSMFSLLESNPKATMKEIEDSFSGNLCRCTGYRPILDAFKSFASDRIKCVKEKVNDIEDLVTPSPKRSSLCGSTTNGTSRRESFRLKNRDTGKTRSINALKKALAVSSLKLEVAGRGQWYKVTEVEEIFEIFTMVSGSYTLVGGNTAQGINKGQPTPEVFIDINSVGFLKAHSFYSGNLYVGANITLSDAIVLFKAVAEENPKYYSYLEQLSNHIEKVANTPVRNVGTLAGNLSIKHRQNDFQSDIFVILETVGALLSVRTELETITTMSLPDYLETDMYKKIILQIILPPLDNNWNILKTYKVAPRAQNAIAHVNGGFLFQVDKAHEYKVLGRPRIVFGGINPNFIHTSETEEYLINRSLVDASTLRTALDILGREVTPDHRPPEPSQGYRRLLAQALFYRVILSLCPANVAPKCRSGGENISRPVSSGKQEFDTDSSRPPLYQPSPKLDSLVQCSGEAEYVYDIPTTGTDLYAALVITKQGPADLKGLDPSEALKVPGAVAFFSAEDIPGQNTLTPQNPFVPDKEELFASKKILYAGQPVGVVVAETQELADFAAQLVHIVYGEKKKPILDVRDVVKNNDSSRIFLREERKATVTKDDVKKVVKGEFKMETQFHFTMETLSCVAIPIEDGLDVFCTSQWPQLVQESVALLLNIPENSINVRVRRVGGGYGQKITRANIVAGACSLAAHQLNRPVRSALKLETVMEAVGKRWPCWFNYEVGVNDEGEIQYLTTNLYADAGSAFNDSVIDFAILAYTNVYDSSVWATKMYDVKTDKACTAWTRAPGTLEAITMAEHIMEHIAYEVGKDPLSVRMRNIDKSYPIESMITLLKEKSDYEARKEAVQSFNKNNLWKKKGISLVLMRFPMDTLCNYHAMVSVYRNDGTVALTHGGVEIGQGINTKAAQVCASALGIPLDYVVVKPTNNLTSPNDGLTGGSFTSESVCYAVELCCIELNKRLESIRKELNNPQWPDLVQAAYEAHISLNVSRMFSQATDYKSYQIFGAVVLEAEVDVLTGEHKVIRADILEDAGKSLNQFVDVGQIEGSFIMGLGYWTSEEVIYDPDTGKVLTNRTLKYKIPGAKDIPVDFRTYILKNGDNPLGILRSKAVGEPPLCLSISVLFAIKQALMSARSDLGLPDQWLNMDAPFTAENIVLSSGIDASKYFL